MTDTKSEASDALHKAGFDHPCRQTCSGWQQGYDRGYDELKAKHERVLQMLELAVAQLQYTQNLFKAEDLDNSVVLSMIAHEIAQIESLKK